MWRACHAPLCSGCRFYTTRYRQAGHARAERTVALARSVAARRSDTKLIVRPMNHLGDNSMPQPISGCGTVSTEPTLVGPFQGERMARREFQKPSVLRQEGPRPYWYIRYRRKVLVSKNRIKREEKWHRLGYCDDITKRQAERRSPI